MESPNAKGQSYLIVGLFVLVSLIVAGGFVIFMGGTGVFSSEMRLGVYFKDARGLNIGAPVYLSGVDVGRVLGKSLPADGKGALVSFSVDGAYSERVKSTAQIAISSAGMLGDKTLVVTEGVGGVKLSNGDLLMAKEDNGLDAYINQGGQAIANVKEITDDLAKIFKDGKAQQHINKILENLEKASENLKKNTEGDWGSKIDKSLSHIESIATKIDKGQGTLGALINDTSLHEDLRVLLGGAKRSKIIRFVVKQAISNSDRKGGSDQAAPNSDE